MGKQGTITSFFGPNTSSAKSASKSSKKTEKSSALKDSNKRPRPQPEATKSSKQPKQSPTTSPSGPSSQSKPSFKRLKKLSEGGEDGEDDEDFNTLLNLTPEKKQTDENDKGNTTDKAASAEKSSKSSKTTTTDVKVKKASESPEKSTKSQTSENKAQDGSDSDHDEDQDNFEDEQEEEQEVSKPVSKSSKQKKSKPSSVKTTEAVDASRLSTKKTWKAGKPVPYKFLAEAFAKVEEISGRLEIQAILTQLLRDILTTTPDDLVPAIYLCINKLAPAHHGIELGIGESILLKALSQVTGRTVNALKDTYKKVGDLGDVASAARTTQKTMFPPPPLTVKKVFSELKAIAEISGKNTQDAKRSKIVKMMVAASKAEAKYIARALLGKLRIHLADKTVIAALSAAVTLEKKGLKTDVLLTGDGKKKSKMSKKEEEIEEELKKANITLNAVYSQLPVWDVIVPKLLQFKVVDDRLVKACKLIPGVPVSPMLAKPTKAIAEILERFEDRTFTCEYKYDGERAQIHRLSDGSMKVYSRNAEDLTPKYPDLVRDLPNSLHEDFSKATFIIDGEAVAYDVEKKQILPFQELQSRKRKDVDADDVKVKVCIFAFDLLFFNDESLITMSLEDRRKHLQKGFVEHEGQFMFAKGHDSRDPEQIMELLNDSIKAGCEGLMVKALQGTNSTYEPANRSQNWLKVKKDYLDGCGDSLDLVPIGGYLGRGKRTGTFGAFLLACYDPDAEEYQSICKLGTGFSDEDLENFAKFFNEKEQPDRVSRKIKSYYKAPQSDKLAPDVWFEPLQVWEVKCADLSISPLHTAAVGHVDEEKGIALRFPRFIRVRDDKNCEDATSAEQVAEFYLRQSSVANNQD